MRRVSIQGTSGSGKSTLGRALGDRLGVPYVEMDEQFHLPGWKERDPDDFRDRIAEAAAAERWVIDGNYSKVQDLVLARADTLIWLDYPFSINLRRVVWRTIRRVIGREIVCNGNRESFFKSFFTRDSIIWWVVTSHTRRHRACQEFFAAPGPENLTRLRFGHPRETEAWLLSLDQQ